MAEDVAAARRVLAQLADLLRMSLDQMGRREVAVEEEVDFLRRYVDIHRARFGDTFTVEWAIDDDVRRALLPSMVLQPCVENAIRHGIEPRGPGGRITIAARAVDKRLLLDITDNGPGTSRPVSDGQHGMGLVNVQARLETLYGNDHSFEAGNGPSAGFRVHVAIPLVYAEEGAE
jgi:sensor histidine kinase YesM